MSLVEMLQTLRKAGIGTSVLDVTKGQAITGVVFALYIVDAGTINFTTVHGEVITGFTVPANFVLPVSVASVDTGGTSVDIWAIRA